MSVWMLWTLHAQKHSLSGATRRLGAIALLVLSCGVMTLWRMDGLEQAGIADPVAGLVLGAPRPVDTLLVGGRVVVGGGELRTADEAEIGRDVARAARRVAERTGAAR